MVGEYNIRDIYQGGYDAFKPNYGDIFTGYHVPASSVGAPTKPDTANQIIEVNKLISQGIVPIEFSALSPEVFESIPKQHFDEVRRMAKLTGAKISVHAPLIEPSGISQGKDGAGGRWTEANRKFSEDQLKAVVEKSYSLDHRGNMPIVIHSAGIPGTEYEMTKDGKKIQKLVAINRETGNIVPLIERMHYLPGAKGVREEKISPKEELDILNNTEWHNSLREIEFSRENAERILNDIHPHFRELYLRGDIKELSSEEYEMIKKIHSAAEFVKQAEIKAHNVFNNVYEIAKDEKNKKAISFLNELSKEYSNSLGDPRKDLKSHDPKNQSDALFKLVSGLQNGVPQVLGGAPRTYIPIEDFAIEKSAKTFGNVAFHGYKKFGDKAPVISIENLYPGFAFSTGEDMNKLILASKEQFMEKLMKEEGMSKNEAAKKADRVIGLTFDVGHLNMHKKHGFKNEDLMKEFKEMAKHTTHVHLTDNFGFYDSHLPLGMGNVPIGKFMEMLEKEGKEGEIRKIVEAGGWAQHFGVPSHAMTLEAVGSPVYSEGVGPYWNQNIGLQQGYWGGYGEMLPGIHYESFGAGFSQLPSELGGDRGRGSRMSGKPME